MADLLKYAPPAGAEENNSKNGYGKGPIHLTEVRVIEIGFVWRVVPESVLQRKRNGLSRTLCYSFPCTTIPL